MGRREYRDAPIINGPKQANCKAKKQIANGPKPQTEAEPETTSIDLANIHQSSANASGEI
jgi:hypothetical protein